MPEPQTADFSDREFLLTDKDFKTIAEMVREKTGIVLAEHKKQMVYARLAKRLRQMKMQSFTQYIDFLNSPSAGDELVNFVNAITTNLTSFFRESHHFDHLGQQLKKIAASGQRRIRIWSAGCSAGPEPYSIAMTAMENIPNISSLDFKILATDIDTNMVATAARGEYEEKMADGISPALAAKYTRQKIDGRNRPIWQMNETLKSLISFKQLNLLEDWPMKGPFDIIFCRNVVIYFDKDTQRVLFDRYADMVKDRGWLYIGHSESLSGVCDRFRLEGKTVYQRVK